MNKRERVMAAFNNQPVDYVPTGFWFHFPEDAVSDEQVVANHLQYYHAIDADMVKIMSDGYFCYPNEQIEKIHTPQDWKNLTPMGKDSPFIRNQVSRCRALRDKLGAQSCTFYNVFNPMSYLRFQIGEERLMHDLHEAPEAMASALDAIGEDAATLCEKVITEGGCDGVYFCVQNAEQDRFTVEEYNQLVAPSEKKALARANGVSGNNILHCCGYAGVPNHMAVWQNYPAKVVNWAVFVENLSLREGKEFFGGRCVLGGFDNTPKGVLLSGTKAEIKQYTEKLLEETGTRGVVLGGDCTFPRGTDVARFKWVMDAARAYKTV
ncbi:MAG: uroporphyrinogen decarboxylase family protein [Gemmiger sp.]|nr:uroporphyrinogen decarboxylase family protein [Gemmiger sp.]